MIKVDLPEQFVATATQIFLENRHASESELVEKITAKLGEVDLAERLVEFVPLAFGRVILKRIGVQLPNTFERMIDAENFSPECPLDWEPIWKPAMKFARNVESRVSREEFLMIASRSAEFAAVNKACHAGSHPTDLVGSTPIFTRAAPLPSPPPKRWWEFWKSN